MPTTARTDRHDSGTDRWARARRSAVLVAVLCAVVTGLAGCTSAPDFTQVTVSRVNPWMPADNVLWEVNGTSVKRTQSEPGDEPGSATSSSVSYELADERAFLQAVSRFLDADDEATCMDATEYSVVATDDEGTQHGSMLQYCDGREKYIDDLMNALGSGED